MSSTFIYFNGEYYKYNGGEKEEQGLAIGGYELSLLANLVTSYMFENSKTIINQTTYHNIYRTENMVLLQGNKSVQEIEDWLAEFQ